MLRNVAHPQRLSLLVAVCLLGIWAGGSGCALLGGGDNDSSPKAKGYRISIPSGWHEEDRNESDRAFRLPSGNVATINSSCTRNSDAPLEVLTRHLLFGSRNVEIVERERLKVDGADALLSKVKAKVDGVPFQLHLVVLPRGGCVFDFSLMSPKTISDAEGRDFLTFVQSFNHGSH